MKTRWVTLANYRRKMCKRWAVREMMNTGDCVSCSSHAEAMGVRIWFQRCHVPCIVEGKKVTVL